LTYVFLATPIRSGTHPGRKTKPHSTLRSDFVNIEALCGLLHPKYINLPHLHSERLESKQEEFTHIWAVIFEICITYITQ